jgi:hypothetical protein
MRIGQCYRCGASLSRSGDHQAAADPVIGSIRNMDYELWIAQQMGEFIQYQTQNPMPLDFKYVDTLQFWLGRFSLSCNLPSAKLLGVSDQVLHNCFRREIKPRLRVTLNLCWVMGLSLVEFVLKRSPKMHTGSLRPSVEARARHASVSVRKKINRTELERTLTRIIQENLYVTMSFTEICEKKIRRGDIVVRECFPELCRTISQRYLRQRTLIAECRRQQYAVMIKTMARHLHAQGIVPNHKTLRQYVDPPTRLRCDYAIQALREVREELGYYSEGEQLLLYI